MSWSFYITIPTPATEAINRVRTVSGVPEPVKDYIVKGIEGLQRSQGPDSPVEVRAYGHIHSSDSSDYDLTTASIEVKKA